MEAKEIKERADDLVKASAQHDPPSTLIQILSDLKTGVKANESLLRSTKIGIIVNKLKAHKDPSVAREASALVSKWKNDVKPGGTPSPGGVGGSNRMSARQANGGSAAASASPAPKDEESKKEMKGNSVPPEQRTSVTDKVNIKVTSVAARDNCIKLMYDGLAFMSEDGKSRITYAAHRVFLRPFCSSRRRAGQSHRSGSGGISGLRPGNITTLQKQDALVVSEPQSEDEPATPQKRADRRHPTQQIRHPLTGRAEVGRAARIRRAHGEGEHGQGDGGAGGEEHQHELAVRQVQAEEGQL